MYLYSSNANNIKILLDKNEIKSFLKVENSEIVYKNIIIAIFFAALPKSKFKITSEKILIKFSKISKDKYILNFTYNSPKTTSKIYCYRLNCVEDIFKNIEKLKLLNATVSKLYCNSKYYFILTDKFLKSSNLIKYENIKEVIEEYSKIISLDAVKEIGVYL